MIQWFLFGRRWIVFYVAIIFFVILLTVLLKNLGYQFYYKEVYWLFFGLVFFVNFLPTLVFSIVGALAKEKTFAPNNTINPMSFLVIIPAYNEKEVILNSVQSLLKQKTGVHHQADIVVAFNGTDDTGEIASKHGATVITTPKPKCGKSQAIAYVLSQITPSQYDYVIIIDADNVVEEAFLAQTALACQDKRPAYQCNHQPLLASDNWISKGLQAAYCASSRLFNLGRSRLLDSALLCGTGMVLRTDVILDLWNKVKTQTEDIEFNGLLSLHYQSGVTWIDGATFYDEKPDVIDVAIRQRVRWMVGHMRCCYHYSLPLIVHFLRTGQIRSLELAWYYLVPISLLASALWLILFLPIIMIGHSYDVLGSFSTLMWITIAIFAYIIILPALGYFLQNHQLNFLKRMGNALVYSIFAMFFALFVWPISILVACFSLYSTTWIFHTPHKVNKSQ